MAGDDGLASAVALAMAEAGQLVPDEGPMPLLPLLDAEAIEVGRDRPGGIGAAVNEAARRPCRPRGAINKRTVRTRDYLLSRCAHPLEVLAVAVDARGEVALVIGSLAGASAGAEAAAPGGMMAMLQN